MPEQGACRWVAHVAVNTNFLSKVKKRGQVPMLVLALVIRLPVQHVDDRDASTPHVPKFVQLRR
jgi:hypothetical protein